MSGLDNRIGIFDQVALSLVMLFIWTRSDMWEHSLWVNETDVMSFAEHGLSGFGYGYGGFVFLLHILWQLFGENDLVFRSLSLISSLLTMILIYRICIFLHDRKSGIVASFIFIWSAYGIEFGMQVRDYAIHSLVLMSITFWCLHILERDRLQGDYRKLGFSSLFASFGLWFVSDHWFCLFFLFFLFTSFIVSFISEKSKQNSFRKIPLAILPPIMTFSALILFELFRMFDAVSNSLSGEHHLGGGSVPLVTMEPMDFFEVITSQSIILSAIVIFSSTAGTTLFFLRKDRTSFRFLGFLSISTTIMWISLSAGQFHLHGLIVERYFYFWFPLICVFCGASISETISKISSSYPINPRALMILPYLLIGLVCVSAEIEPNTEPYGDMRGGFEIIDSEVDDSSFTIISRPPEHVLQYYIRQFGLVPDNIIGAWHVSELDSENICEIDTEVVVVISLQSGWILEESSNCLEESGYIRDESATFRNSGDTIWFWRR